MSSALFDAPLLPAGVWFIPRRDPGNQWGQRGRASAPPPARGTACHNREPEVEPGLFPGQGS